MLVTYSNSRVIKCDRLYHCNLNKKTISKIANVIEQQVSIEHISFSYRFAYNELHFKSTTLSHYINKVIFCGHNMHSKGAYMIRTPSTIQYSYSLPHQLADDYLTGVVCHNIQSKSSYLTAIQTTLCTTIKNSLKNIHDMKKITLTDNNINEEAADDIGAVLSHMLRKLCLGGNDLGMTGVIKIAKYLKNAADLIVLNLNNNNFGEEGADDVATILSHNIKLQNYI